ncbi:MAG TPA: hypothetical protein VER03_24590 [Bryobacteraceae bacterium]|nr:hypothetical protein [Bryobacteraceae bacterium]
MIGRSVAAFLSALSLYASGTAAWEMNTYADFMRGRFSGVSLTRDGRMVLAPRLQPIFSSDEPSIWSVAEGPDKSLFVGTGHRGRLYRVDAKGVSSLLWTAPEPEIFAIATGPGGAVFAGTSPDGKVYRIVNGVAEEYFAPKERYIWSLCMGSDGALYVGAGDTGKVYRVTAKGVGGVWFETGQSHVTALTLDRHGRVLAGTEPNGLIYRLEGKDKAFVLYDAAYPEIRTLFSAPDGSVYAAAQGGSVAQRTNAAGQAAQPMSQTPQVTAPTISVTVTDEGAAVQSPPELTPKTPDNSKPQQQTAPILPGQTVYTAPTSTDVTGVDKSALFRISPDNTVETLWTSKEENIYDVLVVGGQVLFSTDENGRIYRMGQDRRVTLIAQTNEGETTRLVASGDSILAATGSMGKLYRLSESASAEGAYESPVHDAGSVARWGQLGWRGERKGNGKLLFRTRSGNSARPDRTWSDWSAPMTDPAGVNVTSPNARFIQWKAEFAGGTASSPVVSGVSLAYLPQNNPPVVQSLNVVSQIMPITSTSAKAAGQQAASGTYSITVTDTGEAGASTLSGTPAQTLTRGYSQQIQIIWSAEDPDGDRLAYSLYFRGEDETEWKLIRGNFSETLYTLEGDVLADGRYLFRLIASDRPSNAGDASRQAELVSAPVLFDATPPVVSSAGVTRTGASAQIVIRAADAASALRRAEYSLDATAWIPIDSIDGVVDGRQEEFRLRLDSLAPGEHIVVIRAYDASNNVGLAKVVLR